MAHVMVMHESPRARDIICRALRREAADGASHTLTYVDHWTALGSRIRAPLVRPTIAIVDPYFGGVLATPHIRAFLHSFPFIPLLCYGDTSGKPIADAFRLHDLGVRYALTMNVDDTPAHVCRCMVTASCSSITTRLTAVVRRKLGREAGDAVHRTLEIGATDRCVEALATAYQMHVRDVARFHARLGLPSPAALLRRCGLLHAALLYMDPARTVQSVALALHYEHVRSLTRQFDRDFGAPITSVRKRHSSARTLCWFLRFVTSPRRIKIHS